MQKSGVLINTKPLLFERASKTDLMSIANVYQCSY